ncbi:MAG TPA: hypothetical protein VKP30_30805, partial [Polyangiaceae bacterium]|nr:hypothetical protein [Polyangiaceae bacterium]
MRIPSNTGVLLFFGVASCAVGFGACSGDEEPTQASGNSGNSGNSAGGARAGGAGPRGGTIGTSGTTKATGGATTGKATGGAGGAAPTNTGQVAMAGRGYAGTAGTSDIGTVVNPTDLSCLKMTSLWVRAQGPMAVGMLYRIETCKGETVQLVPKQGESVFTYYKLQEDGQNLSSECVPTVDLSQGQRVYVSLMLDLSTSTTGDAARVKSLFDSAKLFAENVPAASPKVFIGVRAFAGDTSPKDILLPTRDLAAVNAALDKTALDNGGLADPGSTNLYGAFKSGVEDLQTWQEKILANNQGGVVTSGYLVVFTDGRDTSKLVEQSTAIATVSGARAAGATAESRPNVQTYAVALAEGADYTLDAKKDLQAVVGVGTDSRLIEGSLSTLSARFQELAKRIGEQAAGTHLLKYCSAARSQKTAVTLGVNPSIGGTDPTSTRLGFTFDAATLDVTAYKGGCIAYFQNVCLESNCGGYNCGACDESIETCESTTTSIPSGGTAPPVTKTVYRCTNNCIDQNRCSGETLTNWAGYTQSCSFTGVVGKCINVCTDLQSDSKNCGVCGKTCNTTAGESCVQGVCGCTNGGTICAGTCQLPSFFEANNANCGTCGKTCNTTAGESCVQGVCACPSGGTICGGTCRLPSFFETSNANCGICGNACPTGIACSGRVCQCPTGEVACSGTCRAVSFFV